MNYERMLDKAQRPSEETIRAAIGEAELWSDLREYLDQSYDFKPELVFYGRRYGWTIRYRKSGKTLCSLFPEQGAFTALVVLGKKEADKVIAILDRFSAEVQALIGGAKQLHDGKWLWIRVLEPRHVEDVKMLLAAKRKPLSDSG